MVRAVKAAEVRVGRDGEIEPGRMVQDERWEGGRVRTVLVDGKPQGQPVYFIELRVAGYKRVVKKLGSISPDDARTELSRFKDDPRAYRSPQERKEDAHTAAALAEQERVEEKRAREAGAVYLTDDLIDAFITDLRDGYDGQRKKRKASRHHLFVADSYLAKWAGIGEKPSNAPLAWGSLKDRDLRTVTADELHSLVSGIKASRKHWIYTLKSLTAWLRATRKLRSQEDPTVGDQGIRCQQTEVDPEAKAAKVYDLDHVAKTYAAIPNQSVRDVFRLRLAGGLHVSEIRRVAKGHCKIKVLSQENEAKGPVIAAVVEYKHKSGEWHRNSIGAAALAAIRRLQSSKSFPTEKTFKHNREEAAKGSGTPEVFIGDLRHTFITQAEQCGSVVRPQKNGVDLHLVAQVVGHQGTATTQKHYWSGIPPMIVLPVTLTHKHDPVLATAHTPRAVQHGAHRGKRSRETTMRAAMRKPIASAA